MQDNASIYTTKKVRLWFKIYGVEVMEWPPYLLDGGVLYREFSYPNLEVRARLGLA